MNRPTLTLRARTKARARERDQRIRATAPAIDAWTARAKREILGAAAGDRYRLMVDVDHILDRFASEGAAILQRELTGLATWSWRAAGSAWLAAVPPRVWAGRLQARARMGESLLAEKRKAMDYADELAAFMRGDFDDDEAAALIRLIEFPPLSRTQIRRLLDRTAASDGLSAMERITTIVNREKPRLRSLIASTLSDYSMPEDEASAIDILSQRIRPWFEDEEGMNYKARRIARTEGVRIAEDTQRMSWEGAADVIDGIRTWTAGDDRVRDEHQHWHDKLFRRQPDGSYVADDGEGLPDFPAGPNCRCWSVPELADDLTADLPAVNYGAGYQASLGRFEKSDHLADFANV